MSSMMFTRACVLSVLGLTAVCAARLLADEPKAAKVSSFAKSADLADQIDYFMKRAEESLAAKADYDEAKQARTKKDGNTLAVLALTVGMSDEDSPLKASA